MPQLASLTFVVPILESKVKRYRITGFKDPILAARLITIGIYPGKVMCVIRKVLFGGAYYIEIEGCHYALRAHEMDQITKVEIAENGDE